MKKFFLLCIVNLCIISEFFGQFLHYGAGVFGSPELSFEFYQYQKNEYVFYFANEQNETIRFDGLDTTRVSAMQPYPYVYARWDINLRWFLQADAFYFWFRNTASYRNSVDLSDYVGNQNTNIINYNSLQMRWRFSGLRIFGGYVFNKKKSIRPYYFMGLVVMHLSNVKLGDVDAMREYRNRVIFKHLDTYKKITLYNASGWGLRYKGLSFCVMSFVSLGDIDKYADFYKRKNDIDDYEGILPNYKSLLGAFVSISYNLYSLNVDKSRK